MEFHEIANIFPMLTGNEYTALRDDISQNGLLEPIMVYEGKILDGRNRYTACIDLGIVPDFDYYHGEQSPLDYVLSKNLHRRHLNETQRALVASRIANMQRGERTDLEPSANLHLVPAPVSMQEASERLNVSRRQVAKVREIEREAPELLPILEAGEMTAHKAVTLIKRQIAHDKRPVSYHISDDSYEWYTPPEYIAAARGVMGDIDLDPATSIEAQREIDAETFYTKDDDGLLHEWSGRVWLNPPYNIPLIENFIDKIITEYEAGNVTQAIVLTNNSSDTGWFHKLIDYPVCFTRGRIRFWNGSETLATRQGQTIFYLGDNVEMFYRLFSEFGVVMVRYDYKQ